MPKVFSVDCRSAAAILLTTAFVLTGCGKASEQGDVASSSSTTSGPSEPTGTNPDQFLAQYWSRPAPSPSPTPSPTATSGTTSSQIKALIFNGSGTSASDTQSIVGLVAAHGWSYQVVTSAQLETMSVTDIAQYRLIIWPGGDSNVMTSGLTAATRGRVRSAVVNYGVNYVGFCAGAWMAVGPTPSASGPIWGLSIEPGDYLKIYHPNGTLPTAAMVKTTFASGSTRDLVWWGGPYLWSTAGTVIARYPDGSAAITQADAGKGFVVLSGLHPEAPQDWRTGAGLVDSDGLDLDVAWSLIQSAANRTRAAVY